MPNGTPITPNYNGVMICRDCHNDPEILSFARHLQSQHPGFQWMKEKNRGFDG